MAFINKTKIQTKVKSKQNKNPKKPEKQFLFLVSISCWWEFGPLRKRKNRGLLRDQYNQHSNGRTRNSQMILEVKLMRFSYVRLVFFMDINYIRDQCLYYSSTKWSHLPHSMMFCYFLHLFALYFWLVRAGDRTYSSLLRDPCWPSQRKGTECEGSKWVGCMQERCLISLLSPSQFVSKERDTFINSQEHRKKSPSNWQW